MKGQNSLSATMSLGDIPTSLFAPDNSCNGSSNTLSIILPPGDNYTVTNVQVSYQMTATAPGFMADQRSQMTCINTGASESIISGIGNSAGTYSYPIRSTNIANNTYAGNTVLEFELNAWRSFNDGAGACNTTTNKVNNNTWTVTVFFSDEMKNPKVGVNKTLPSQVLDVKGKIRLSDDTSQPQSGTIRWTGLDFEGYNGVEWVSFTKSNASYGWGENVSIENLSSTSDITSENNQRLGERVSITAEYAVAGCPGYKTGGIKSGGVFGMKKFIYSWDPIPIVLPSDPEADSGFGASVALDQNILVVGCPRKTVGGLVNKGKVYVYQNTAGSWTILAELIRPEGAAEDRFGYQVKIIGNYIAVSAPNLASGATALSKVYIYKFQAGITTYLTTITAPDGALGDLFGYGLALTEQTLIIGAPNKTIGTSVSSGKVYIYKRSVDQFLPDGTFNGTAANSFFGFALSAQQKEFVVGLPYFDNSRGKVNHYKKYGNTWILESEIISYTKTAGQQFGSDVSLNENDLVIAAQPTSSASYRGKVFVYERQNEVWNFKTSLQPSDAGEDDFFGGSVGVYYGTIIVGASAKIIAGLQIGAYYLYINN